MVAGFSGPNVVSTVPEALAGTNTVNLPSGPIDDTFSYTTPQEQFDRDNPTARLDCSIDLDTRREQNRVFEARNTAVITAARTTRRKTDRGTNLGERFF
jgi:hypothetical protein